MKFSSDLNLGVEGLCIFTSFHFPDCGFYLLKDFDFIFFLSILNGVLLKTRNSIFLSRSKDRLFTRRERTATS